MSESVLIFLQITSIVCYIVSISFHFLALIRCKIKVDEQIDEMFLLICVAFSAVGFTLQTFLFIYSIISNACTIIFIIGHILLTLYLICNIINIIINKKKEKRSK